MSRKNDLEQLIYRTYGLISEYEKVVNLTSDPRDKVRAESAITEHEVLLAKWLGDYVSLAAKLKWAIPEDITELAAAYHIPAQSKANWIDSNLQYAAQNDHSLLNTGKSWAVLAGANYYEDVRHYRSLQVCVKDIEAIQNGLVANGQDAKRVFLLCDNTSERPTRNNILSTLSSVADAAEPEDLLLFYFSGHGDQDGTGSYLIPSDARRTNLLDTAIRIDRVKEILQQSPARAKVIIIDACHSGANIASKGAHPMTAEFIQHVFLEAQGFAILASCTQQQYSYEWQQNERSVFTYYLLEGLNGQADNDNKGFVTVQDLHRYVTNSVKSWAAQNQLKQTPTLQYQVAGDIIVSRYRVQNTA